MKRAIQGRYLTTSTAGEKLSELLLFELASQGTELPSREEAD